MPNLFRYPTLGHSNRALEGSPVEICIPFPKDGILKTSKLPSNFRNCIPVGVLSDLHLNHQKVTWKKLVDAFFFVGFQFVFRDLENLTHLAVVILSDFAIKNRVLFLVGVLYFDPCNYHPENPTYPLKIGIGR